MSAEGRRQWGITSLEWGIAWRYLRARKSDGFISVIAGFSFAGVMLGVATLIIVMAVMNGFRVELVKKILGVNSHINMNYWGQDIDNYQAITHRLQEIPGIKSVHPVLEQQVMVSKGQRHSGGVVRGIDLEHLKQMPLIADNIIAGRLAQISTENGLAIGAGLADKLGVRVGDFITLLSPRGHATAFGVAPRAKSYKVSAIFQMGMSLYDQTFIFMPLSVGQNFFLRKNKVSALDIFVDNADEAQQFLPSLYEAAAEPKARFVTWQQANQTYISALAVERNVMFLILSLMILVASLNIIAGMIMLVKDKATEIAVLRTLGFSRASIMRIFLTIGMLIGCAGVLVGLLIGVVFCTNIEVIRQFISWVLGVSLFDPAVYFLATMPADLQMSDVVAVMVMALLLTLGATLYPSWRASALDPVKALRYE